MAGSVNTLPKTVIHYVNQLAVKLTGTSTWKNTR